MNFVAQLDWDFPNARTSSGTLLSVTVRMQLVECYLRSGLKEEALKASLQVFQEIIRNSYNLSENQLSAYAAMAREKFNSIRDEDLDTISSDTTYVNDFENLNALYQNQDQPKISEGDNPTRYHKKYRTECRWVPDCD